MTSGRRERMSESTVWAPFGDDPPDAPLTLPLWRRGQRDATLPTRGESQVFLNYPSTDRDRRAVELGRRIRERRRELGLTQSELAAPFTKSYLSAVERGRTLPSLRALWLIASRLGTGVGDLAGDVNILATPQYNRPHGRRPTAGSHPDHDDPDPPAGRR